MEAGKTHGYNQPPKKLFFSFFILFLFSLQIADRECSGLSLTYGRSNSGISSTAAAVAMCMRSYQNAQLSKEQNYMMRHFVLTPEWETIPSPK